MTSRLTYTVPEVAELLGISSRSIYRAVHSGTLPNIHLGQRVLIPAQALQAWIAQYTLVPITTYETTASHPVVAGPQVIPNRRPRRRILAD